MSKMKPEVAKRRIESFEKRFGKAHLYLAYHAAFPLSLTPDLLYRLWANFQRDIYGEVLGIPWIAVGDLLLSSLCDEVGHELYEMDLAVRNMLLSQLKEDEKFGQPRINELSNFLVEYVRQQLQSDDPDIRDFAQVQQCTALAYVRPSEAVHELALAFSKLDDKDAAELVRMASLTETLAEPLAEFQPLLIYARGMENFARGKLEVAKAELNKVLDERNQIRIAAVNLPVPEQIKANLPNRTEVFITKEDFFSPHPSRKKNFLLFMGLFIGAVTYFGAGVWFIPKLNQFYTTLVVASCQNNTQPERGLKISLGEKILLKGDTNPDKQAGIQAFANKDFQTAIDKFTSYRQTCRLDPEALIYLNNAQALKKGNLLKIAVSVPIGSTQNIAKEILRGVAQAQDEVNSNGGINGKLLQVAIANDDNDPIEAVQLATQFVKDASILAVVGHNASNASLSAAPAYQGDGLVMMSPTSFAQNLAGIGNYIFRTVPNVSLMADGLSRYAIKAAGKTNFFICVDSKAIDNQSFKDEFVKAIKAAGGTINSTNCDVSASNFNPNAVISQAISNGADALVLGLYIDRIKQGLAVAQANKGRLALFSSPTLYTSETFQVGKADINGMVLAAPWHPQALPGNPFGQKSQKFWGGIVNWRTATAYDATKTIIAGLQQSNTRDGLQQVLHSPNFSVNGATGTIKFSPSGDRIDNSIFLVKVQQKSGSNDYEFVPLPNPK